MKSMVRAQIWLIFSNEFIFLFDTFTIFTYNYSENRNDSEIVIPMRRWLPNRTSHGLTEAWKKSEI